MARSEAGNRQAGQTNATRLWGREQMKSDTPGFSLARSSTSVNILSDMLSV